MTIKGIDGLAPQHVREQVEQGARFVMFSYCVSVAVMTFRRNSPVYFVRAGKNATLVGLPWTPLTLVAGWWGILRGLIWTPMALYTNLRGGRDVTQHFAGFLAPPQAPHEPHDPTVWPPPPTFTLPESTQNGSKS